MRFQLDDHFLLLLFGSFGFDGLDDMELLFLLLWMEGKSEKRGGCIFV